MKNIIITKFEQIKSEDSLGHILEKLLKEFNISYIKRYVHYRDSASKRQEVSEFFRAEYYIMYTLESISNEVYNFILHLYNVKKHLYEKFGKCLDKIEIIDKTFIKSTKEDSLPTFMNLKVLEECKRRKCLYLRFHPVLKELCCASFDDCDNWENYLFVEDDKQP